jgi:transglutaminase-like putative cysteine protease
LSIFRPLPRAVTRPLSVVAVAAWIVTMGVLVNRSYLQASPVNLATDLARYGTAAQWRGVYYRGEKIGFTVSQVQATGDGFELHEDGRLQFTLLGAITPAIIRTTARVDRSFALQSFDFSLDPGTGPMSISGRVRGLRLDLSVGSGTGKRTEVRQLKEPPALMLSVGRRLASEGLTPGTTRQWTVFDPATLQNAPVTIEIGEREIVNAGQSRPIPAFKVQMTFSGLRTAAWVTDTGEIVREESPMGLITVLETQEQAMALAVSNRMQADMLETAAIVPAMRRGHQIVEPRDVVRLKLRLTGAELVGDDVQGVGQMVDGDIIELSDARQLEAGPADRDLERYLKPEPFIESDAPEIRAEAENMVAGIIGTRARAERLVREVNSYVEKRPTVSLPSALEVLRTKVGDCNEHTALFVAMARSIGIPARISVGLAYVRGAFYYHAWPEVYIDEGQGRGLWLPVDPTFNQFPADATHLRLARGGLDKQTAILPLVGRARIAVVDLEVKEGSTPILVGARPVEAADTADMPLLPALIPRRQDCGCWVSPCSGARR